MPRDESCPNYKVCLAGYEPDEIDYACEHCDLILERLGLCDPAVENISPAAAAETGFRRGINTADPEIDGPDPNVAVVLRALKSHQVRMAICGIIKDAMRDSPSLALEIIRGTL